MVAAPACGRASVLAVALATAAIYAALAITLFPSSQPPNNNPRASHRKLFRSAAVVLPTQATGALAYQVFNGEPAVKILTPAPLDPDAQVATSATRSTKQISCPIFSGPGYRKEAHPSHSISIPALNSPVVQTSFLDDESSSERTPRLEMLPLTDVRLTPHTPFHRAFATNLAFLKSVDTDALLLTWRLNMRRGSPWPKGALRLMGWEHTGSELRGHFLGHFLAAAAMSYATAGDAGLAERLCDVVRILDELAGQGEEEAKGYLSAFPRSFLDRLEAITPVWAPYCA